MRIASCLYTSLVQMACLNRFHFTRRTTLHQLWFGVASGGSNGCLDSSQIMRCWFFLAIISSFWTRWAQIPGLRIKVIMIQILWCRKDILLSVGWTAKLLALALLLELSVLKVLSAHPRSELRRLIDIWSSQLYSTNLSLFVSILAISDSISRFQTFTQRYCLA